eukprot:COSAG05_NODE_9395_length_627_cov_0.776515_1_plen_84_part_10
MEERRQQQKAQLEAKIHERQQQQRRWWREQHKADLEEETMEKLNTVLGKMKTIHEANLLIVRVIIVCSCPVVNACAVVSLDSHA